MNKILSNYIYQTLFQLTSLLLPIITIPLVSHALGSEGLGFYSYVMSIVSYFVLVAGLGLNNYGIREIAIVKNDKKKLSEKFWSLEYFNLIIVTLVIFSYVFFLIFVDFNMFFLVSGISIVATMFDISWFYYGIEDFKKITIVNIIVKIVSFLLILNLVKSKEDLIFYFFIQSLSILVSNVTLWFFIKGKINFKKPNFKVSLKHLKPASTYFIGKASITIYTTLNRTILGILTTTVAVGLYTNSLQLTTMVVMLVGTLDSVLLPHMTGLVADNKENQVIDLMSKVINIQLYVTLPLAFGLVSINSKLIPWFFGPDFDYLKYTVPVLAPLIVIIPLGTSIVRQYLMPINNIKKFNISVIIAAIVGIISNLIFIPYLGIWGAIISTLLSELIVTTIRFYELITKTNFRVEILNIIFYLCTSLIMCSVIYLLTNKMDSNIITTAIQVSIGIMVYLSITTVTKKNPIVKIYIEVKGKKDEKKL